ncbi:UPF0595 protein CG11755 [Papilio machaon]|uniref:Cysteine-rich DPF motif domain-containing protein 1 n=1 Tax=Papilio machaon TaxID=76193 RepID=A0A194RKZ6_PAPMA|nr:UPF0595 protein CG11755 [Papilio machaon]
MRLPQEMDDPNKSVEEKELVYDFNCVSCNLNEKAHYKGTKPPFSRNIILKYPSYVMKDPFSPPGKGEVLMLGADCAICDKPVCISKECSIFYMKLFCINCAKQSLEKFPVEIQSKINSNKK